MLRLDLLTLRAFGVVVVHGRSLRLGSVERRTAHDALLSVVDSPATCVSKQPVPQGVARVSDGVRFGCNDEERVLQASWVVDSRRPGVSPAFAHPGLLQRLASYRRVSKYALAV